MLRDSTVENFKFDECHVIAEQVSNSLRPHVSQVRISELQCLQLLIGRLQDLTHLAHAVTIDVAVGDVDSLDV